jgi:predicted dienelactone hydrolase
MRVALSRRFAFGVVAFVAVTIGGCDDDDGFRLQAVPSVAPKATATQVNTRVPSAAATATPAATPTPTTPQSQRFAAAGPAGIGWRILALEDTSRPTMPNGSFPGAPTRRLRTYVWYPTAPPPRPSPEGEQDAPLDLSGAPYPLIVYSHGFMNTATGGTFLGQHLASHGYIVVSPTFPLTQFNAPGGPNVLDVANQPGDVSFLVDEMLRRNDTPGDAFAGAVDPDRIGLTGLSLGGLTTYLATFHPDLRDDRVGAAAPQAGPGCLFAAEFFDRAMVPLLILHGDLDAIVPYGANAAEILVRTNAPTYLLTLLEASHTAFADGSDEIFEATNNADDVGCAFLDLGAGISDASLIDALGGAEAGVVGTDCPGPCIDPTPRPRAMRPSRQLELTRLSVLAFFEATLRGDAAAQGFVEEVLARENDDVSLQRR